MRRLVRAKEIRTGDMVIGRDGRRRMVAQVKMDYHGGLKISMAGSGNPVIWTPELALMTVDRGDQVIDHDRAALRRDVIHRTESQRWAS